MGGSKAARRVLFVIAAMFVSLSAAACGLFSDPALTRGDAERIETAVQIRCTYWEGQNRGSLLGRSATLEVKRVLAEAVQSERVTTPLIQKGQALGFLAVEGGGGSTQVQFFSEPRWVEIEKRYYTLTEAELDAVKQAVEPPGQEQRGHELVP
jgi:hypothetical protein